MSCAAASTLLAGATADLMEAIESDARREAQFAAELRRLFAPLMGRAGWGWCRSGGGTGRGVVVSRAGRHGWDGEEYDGWGST